MKKIVLVIGMMFGLFESMSESLAKTWNCGPKTGGVYSDSVKCTYDETTNVLTVSGNGRMGDYDYVVAGDSSTAPWANENITSIVIEKGVTGIGGRAFKKLQNLQTISGLENITYVGTRAFYKTNLTSIDLPNVQQIDTYAFYGSTNLKYVGLNNSVVIGNAAFSHSSLENCSANGNCGSCEDNYIQEGVGCVSGCYTGYTPYYGYCLRTRYTMPEADAETSNDNENMIEWIFE